MATATANGSITKQDLINEIREVSWFHRINLGDGLITPGIDETPEKLEQIHLPEDLTGRSVLDIGAWDGFFSFECERRGAERVVALDHAVWNSPAIGKKGFELARKVLHSHVEPVDCDVHELTPERVGGTFDLVLFLGVLYHTPHPLWVLQRVANVAANMLILETHVDMNECARPVLAFYPETECASDPSNWFGPNQAALEGMLRSVGFKRVQLVSSTPVGYKVKNGEKSKYGRMVYHAWK